MAKSSQFKFPYIKGRPMIMAKLGLSKNKSRYFRLLIDSGADYTLISKSDAAVLGLNYKNINTKEIKVEIANLAFIHTKKSHLTITIEDNSFKIPVLIAKEEVECLLGRKGIFDKFDILFREKEGQVIFIEI